MRDGLCDPLSSWARAHVRCARALGARALGAASPAPPSEAEVRAYWSEHLLCRGAFANGSFPRVREQATLDGASSVQ